MSVLDAHQDFIEFPNNCVNLELQIDCMKKKHLFFKIKQQTFINSIYGLDLKNFLIIEIALSLQS